MSPAKLFLSACCAAGLAAPHAWSQPPAAPKPAADRGKERIEFVPKKIVAETAPAPRPVAAADENPAVEPGKVTWHKSFADAKAAAEKSRKPVLLFQMMGRLDQQFT